MKITIFVFSPFGDALQDLNYCESHPVGGSETAAMRMGLALQRLGHDATLATHPSQLRNHSCDVFVNLRDWNLFTTELRPGFLNYLWCQDDIDQPQVSGLRDPHRAKRVYDACDGVMMVSHYQQRRWVTELHLPVEKIFQTTNGIPRAAFQANAEDLVRRPPWAFYASAPFRGLEILIKVWRLILQAVPSAQLHIFSSLQVYGCPEEEAYLGLYEAARQLPGATYHGGVGQATLREYEQRCRVLAYPCAFPETSCIVAMEAMAAGCVVVGTSLGALPETAWQNPLVPMEGNWVPLWIAEVVRALADDTIYEALAKQNLTSANFYDWNQVAQRWVRRFREDCAAKTRNLQSR